MFRKYTVAITITACFLTFLTLILHGSAVYADSSHRDNYERPIDLGVSGGNIKDISRLYCCTGTLGALVQDQNGDYILSNNHVLARTNKAELDEAIIQAGLADQSCSADANSVVANLTRFVPISFRKGTNRVDAAIAEVVPGEVDPDGFIRDIGVVSAETLLADADLLNVSVTKSGRTTGQTFGTVAAIDVSVNVGYNRQCGMGSQTALYTGQLRVTPGSFSAGGDSGSLIVSSSGEQPVGLLFAGSSTSTIANPIDEVLDSLCVEMAGSAIFPDPTPCASSGGGGDKPKGPPPGRGKNKGGVSSDSLPFGLEVASEVKARHDARLLGMAGVVGTGLTLSNGKPVIEIYVDSMDEGMGEFSSDLEGIPTAVMETGAFTAY